MATKPASGILRHVRPDILEMLGYEPIEPADVLAEQLGVPADRVVKLDGNENPYGPSPRVIEALATFDAYHRYPDPEQRRLREALAEYAGVTPEHIVAGAGSDELIDLLVRAAVAPGDGVIDCPPTFGMYPFSTRISGGSVRQVERRDDFSVDIGAVRDAARDAKVLFVCSPNNPTGNRMSRTELEGLLALDLLVVLDEAYIEFAGESAAALVLQSENLVVLRTFSKWAGLAGLRAGYGIMAPTLARVLMQMKPPYTPNIAAEVAMLASLEDRERQMESVRAIVEERERMAEQLRRLEVVEVYPSEANFLLCRFPGREGPGVRDALAREGVFVRYFDTPRLRDCIRISVGRPEDTGRLIEALEKVEASRG
jgi:histidinol-phosphate aminotransferase